MKHRLILTAAFLAATVGVTAGGIYIANQFKTIETGAIAMNVTEKYNGHEMLWTSFDNIPFYFSYGLFEDKPEQYNTHLATVAANLANASDNYVNNGDYSNGGKNIETVYKNLGLENIYVSNGYKAKPTSDSIGYVIGEKLIHLNSTDKNVTVLSVTVRSAGYEMEWASNVKLGANGEAEGFKEAADQVKEGIDNYVYRRGLTQKAKDGNLVFFVSGFSRGGATANLTAKRLIDDYQEQGNKVYAYCVEAPQGGVKSAEKAGRDYRGIHNVINPDDLVPYVAPTVMGFKRYGVDHYLFDETYDSNNLKNYNLFSNNLADNRPVEKASDKLKDAVKKQIEDMIPDASKRGKHMPYTMTMYELKVPSFKVASRKAQMATSIFIQKFLNGFASTVSRADYANNGLQTAARHLMIYKESGGDLGGMASCFSGLGIAGLVGDLIVPSLITVVGTGITSLADSVIEIFTGKRPIQEYINNEFLKTLASKITERIVTRSNAVKSIDKNYPGQSKQAYNDIHTIVYTALKGLPGIDDIITLCKGIEDVFHNHSFVQAIAYLRVADSWYNTNTSLPAAK